MRRSSHKGLVGKRLLPAASVCVMAVALAQAPRPTTAIKPLKNGPLSYFASKCERCHGPEGSNYGEGFGKNLSGPMLATKVDEMAKGPGMAPLKGDDLDALVSFHRALIAEEPFVCWTGVSSRNLTGEATSGSKITLFAGKTSVDAILTGNAWKAMLPSGIRLQTITIKATKGKKVTLLRLDRSAYSHAEPVKRRQ